MDMKVGINNNRDGGNQKLLLEQSCVAKDQNFMAYLMVCAFFVGGRKLGSSSHLFQSCGYRAKFA